MRLRSSWPLLATLACGPGAEESPPGTTTGPASTDTGGTSTVPTTGPTLDAAADDLGDFGGTPVRQCTTDGTCGQIDILVVVDNSATMGPAQQRLVARMSYLVETLRYLHKISILKDYEPDVHLMVTTTDFGHPLCQPLQKPDYAPARGAPIATACTDRLQRFTALDGTAMPEVCTAGCPEGQAVAPSDPFIAFRADEHNIVGHQGDGDPVAAALACVLPQGVDGCAMEAPLEAMLQALDPNKDWNTGPRPFLRPQADLMIVLLTDDTDCSQKDYAYTDPGHKGDPEVTQYWEDLPGMPGVKGDPTGAVCWNAGMTCDGPDGDGIYTDCAPVDAGVLHPLERYTGLLADLIAARPDHRVAMLLLAGVPPVTAHNLDPPFEPTAGGLEGLVHRTWTLADILPGDPSTPADKEYEHGIGPGCSDPATGQALPPGRMVDVCRSLDRPEDPADPYPEPGVRCCIESVCAADFRPAVDCLTGVLTREPFNGDIPG